MNKLFMVANLCIVVFCGGLMLGFFQPQFELSGIQGVSEAVGCEGIEQFYTGNGFVSDYNFLQRWMIPHRDWESGDGIDIQPPSEMGKGIWNCQDISHAYYCLAEKYNVECNFYLVKVYNSKTNINNHIGIECLVDECWGKLE